MNHTPYIYVLASLLAGFSVGAQEQTIYGGRLTIDRHQPLRPAGDSLTIDFTLDASRLEMPSTRSLTLTPLLAGEDTLRLSPVLLNGRNRQQVYLRRQALDGEGSGAGYYAVLKAAGGKEQTVAYRQTVRFEPWMKEARLWMEEDLCGCGGHTEEVAEEPLFAVEAAFAAPVPAVETPFEAAYSYVEPAPETVKNRTELKDIYLHFPVNRTVIDSGYGNNRAELAAARGLVERILTDRNLIIREVVIRGYASPEGSVASNRRLSEGRAAALEKYLASRLQDASVPMRSEGGGEDWGGVIDALRAHPTDGVEELLAALEASDRSDASEQALRRIGDGNPYREMAEKIYPKVRRVVCWAAYTARAFSLEESRELIRRHPEQLSLYEMWQVAESYPENSEAFNETLRIAVRSFPHDDTALLNAANVALAEGNYDEAAALLGRIRHANAASENAAGLLSMFRNDRKQAAAYFRKAAEAGSESGRKNLSQLANDDANN